MTIAAIVLAGGASTRFGTDKLAEDLDGRPLLHHALDACGPVADRMVLVVSPDRPALVLPSTLADRIVVVRDPVAHRGPLAGLAAGLEAIPDAEVALVAGGDMPSLVPAVLRLMADRLLADAASAAATLETDPPSPLPMAVRPIPALVAARALLSEDRRSLRSLLDRMSSFVVAADAWRALDPARLTLVDVDTRRDLPASRRHG
jgi:molybdopterin-guanine dinucleotide biosynthesis protein A